MLPLDFHALESALLRGGPSGEERTVAPPRGATVESSDAIAAFFREVGLEIENLESSAEMTRRGAEEIVSADQYFSPEVRAGVERISARFREWAPIWARRRLQESDPLMFAFPAFFRRYNDAVTKMVRALVDSASAIDRRLQEDDLEDAEADDWASRNAGKPLSPPGEETFSTEEVRKLLFGSQ